LEPTPLNDLEEISFRPLGRLESCFKQKFGIPRQPGLVEGAWAVLPLPKTDAMRQAIDGLDGFSHLWLIFVFNQTMNKGWSPRVRPPRLGGEKTKGVFATRSPFRPNAVGLSAVAYHGSQETADAIELKFGGADLVQGTPILDIKPYLSYVDSIPDATSGWLPDDWVDLEVHFAADVDQVLEVAPDGSRLKSLISSCLKQDPRPAYHRKMNLAGRSYGFELEHWNVRFKVEGQLVLVTELSDLAGFGKKELRVRYIIEGSMDS
jgi:tRNA-Thr(GGU) m(6)t(6)A37 methyltransferase TsaA